MIQNDPLLWILMNINLLIILIIQNYTPFWIVSHLIYPLLTLFFLIWYQFFYKK